MNSEKHVPVMLRECIEALKISPGGIYVDGTLGRGGHALEIARRLDTGRLVGIDKDMTAIRESAARFQDFGGRVTLVHGDFREAGRLLDELGIEQIDGVLLDLGVSSPQLDEAGRGFSYMADAPLDMRMDRENEFTAYDVVNKWPEDELRRILYEYGEERYARGIVRSIIKRREEAPLETTGELVAAIKRGMPASALREKQHPAKRTFQAVRIAVNDELGALAETFEPLVPRLRTGGRIAVISFHSLEDRIVKNAIAAREKGCVCPPDFPVCVCGFTPTLRAVPRKAITPGQEEIRNNPRSRSAKLRVAQKV